MKYLITICIAFSVLSCVDASTNEKSTITIDTLVENNSTEKVVTNATEARITSDMDYAEYYPSGILKIEGDYNQDKQRQGLWFAYYEDGSKWSESFYVNGLKNGHSITFFPNGKVRYVGEYKDDKQIGPWTFYDENGALVEEKEF